MKTLALILALSGSSAQLPVTKVNMMCGIPPIPPIGCRVGPCQCNQFGQNCQFVMVCR